MIADHKCPLWRTEVAIRNHTFGVKPLKKELDDILGIEYRWFRVTTFQPNVTTFPKLDQPNPTARVGMIAYLFTSLRFDTDF
tara:strand:+ start:7863 stop:8108 length:246 start_codon:yes stop_codon:yes gene_type:complete